METETATPITELLENKEHCIALWEAIFPMKWSDEKGASVFTMKLPDGPDKGCVVAEIECAKNKIVISTIKGFGIQASYFHFMTGAAKWRPFFVPVLKIAKMIEGWGYEMNE